MVDPLSGIALGDNVQAGNYKGRRWVYNTPAGTDEKGKNSDPSTKVVIMMSRRIVNKTLDSVYVGIRENFWNSLQHILYINLHSTQRKDTITQLQQLLLLQTIPKSDYIMLAGDFNCQIPRNIPGCTGR